MYYVCRNPSTSGLQHADSITASLTSKAAKRKVSTALEEAHQGSRNGSEDLI